MSMYLEICIKKKKKKKRITFIEVFNEHCFCRLSIQPKSHVVYMKKMSEITLFLSTRITGMPLA